MRSLYRTVALLALTGCMSNASRVDTTKVGPSLAAEADLGKDRNGVKGPLVENADGMPSGAGLAPAAEAQASNAADPVAEIKSACEASKTDVKLPVFLKESSALVVALNQVCREAKDTKVETLRTNMALLGVACTGSPGFITRRGHSNHDWEVITFALDLNCKMATSDQIKTLAKQKFGITLESHNVTFIPMMIDYWEFEKNNDAGLGSSPTLTASGGGAAQWKKTETKAGSFPIKLYGRSSTFGKDQPVYEAKVTLLSKSNQRQFDVQVEDMRMLSEEELKTMQDRCKSKTRSEKGCREAFEN